MLGLTVGVGASPLTCEQLLEDVVAPECRSGAMLHWHAVVPEHQQLAAAARQPGTEACTMTEGHSNRQATLLIEFQGAATLSHASLAA
jgi:hypothetical protein